MAEHQLLRTLEAKVNPQLCAVLVIDMQNDFCSPGGFVDHLGMDLSAIDGCVRSIQRLIHHARVAGIDVVHIRSHFDPQYMLPPMIERLERKKSEPYCVSGTWGAEFVKDLEPIAGESVITKHRYSGFYATNLDITLRAKGIQTVILTGTATNNCVDGTGRDAFYNGYYAVMVSDATAASSEALHESALKTADHAYAVIATSDEICTIWSTRTAPAASVG